MFLRLILVSLLVITPHIGHAKSLPEQLRTCSNISESLDRLNCYDRLVATKPLNTQAKTEIKSKVIKTQPLNTDHFGQEHKLVKATPNKINVTILKAKKSLRGRLVITLDNGQEWHQTDSTSFRINKNTQTYIKKAALGSFVMGQEGRNKTMKVKRIK